MRSAIARIVEQYREVIVLALAGIPIGLAVGAVCALFGRVLLAIGAVRDVHVWLLIPLLAPAGALIAWVYRRWGGSAGRGMGLVFAVGHGDEREIPLRLVPLIMVSTWITHLFGGSAGREGVAVQIGATVSHWAGTRLAPRLGMRDAGRVFLVCGMAAGFAGLFRTPLAACAFALEVLVVGRLNYRALPCALTAACTASFASGALGLEKFEVSIDALPALEPLTLVALAFAGALFGIVGGGFAWLLGTAKAQAARIANPVARIVIMGAALSVLLLALGQGRYAGLGTNLINAGIAEAGAGILPWDWAVKLALTVFTLAAGFQGGEVTPLFSIGASLGAVLAGLLGLPVPLVAALGYAAVFGGATNTLIAPVLIGGEVFGFANLPAFAIVCSAAYLFNLNRSIYAQKRP